MQNVILILYFSFINSFAQTIIKYPNGQIKWKAEYSKSSNLYPVCYEAWDSNGNKTAYFKSTSKRTTTIYWTSDGIKMFYSDYKNGQPISCMVNRRKGDTSKFIMPDKYPCTWGNKTVFMTNDIAYDSSGNKIENEFKGKQLWWDENGKLQSELYYRKGKKQGKFREWNKDGTLKVYEIYKKGKLIRKIV